MSPAETRNLHLEATTTNLLTVVVALGLLLIAAGLASAWAPAGVTLFNASITVAGFAAVAWGFHQEP